jgi:hypothetical protein
LTVTWAARMSTHPCLPPQGGQSAGPTGERPRRISPPESNQIDPHRRARRPAACPDGELTRSRDIAPRSDQPRSDPADCPASCGNASGDRLTCGDDSAPQALRGGSRHALKDRGTWQRIPTRLHVRCQKESGLSVDCAHSSPPVGAAHGACGGSRREPFVGVRSLRSRVPSLEFDPDRHPVRNGNLELAQRRTTPLRFGPARSLVAS